MTAPPRLEPGAVFAGDFVVERRLATGGMGAVYVVEQRSTGHRRALKVMHPDVVAEPRNRERFTQEARVGALIRSPYVVEVAAAGVDDATGTPWLLMELLEGESLAERVARGALPDRATLREMFAQLSDALGRAHAVGVVHRDLKPENLFIAASRIRGVPFLMKVLDFGIAAIVSEQNRSATVTTVIGSPMWMAPEQADVGARVGAQADVWALGLIAFYALTGRYFWPSLAGDRAAFNVAALLVDIVVHPIPTPSARGAALGVGDRLPDGFDGWFARCVARDPTGRFPDARAALDALLPLLAGAPASDPALGATLLANAPPAAPPPVAAPPAAATQAPATQAPPTHAPVSLPAASQPVPSAPPKRRWAVVAAAAALTAAGVVAAVALGGSRTNDRPPVVGARVTPPAQPDAAAAAKPDAAARAAPDAAPADVAAAAPTADAAVAVEGELAVACSRRCQVSVDGDDRGAARRPFALAAGEHVVVATRGGRSLTQTVRVTAGETARLSFEFDDAPADAAAPTPPAARPTPPAARPTTPAAPLPDRPDRAAVESTFRDVAAAARRCGASGRVFVNADFSGEGRVTAAQVEGPLAGTPTGECIARAARRAQVPPFRRPMIRVTQALDL